MRYMYLLALIGVLFFASVPAIHAQDDPEAKRKLEEFQKQNRIRSIETEINSKLKDVDARFAKKEILKENGKEKEVINYRQPMVYEKGMLVHKDLFQKFKTESAPDKKIKAGEETLQFLDKMIGLYRKDTEKLEKQLKKEKDLAKLRELIEKGV